MHQKIFKNRYLTFQNAVENSPTPNCTELINYRAAKQSLKIVHFNTAVWCETFCETSVSPRRV